ncbi:uncharacterized protein EI97DRAFT_472162 [Westerdykella ornata]|uniref:Uncharacterized protein n=1 Tax=Westerdykella ornata TaxID=318751 RepID=A0A6A6JZ05_WESOR|nr:uncharacterized protein EI97DRAFT_472162 [Westerdykella ornata]KAF2280986.1 hypothetical protein EI97DRAFT_472162 [Westerdykella ornata]
MPFNRQVPACVSTDCTVSQEANSSPLETGKALADVGGPSEQLSRANSRSSQEQTVKLQVYKDTSHISEQKLKPDIPHSLGKHTRPQSQTARKVDLGDKTRKRSRMMPDTSDGHIGFSGKAKSTDENHPEARSHTRNKWTGHVSVPDQPQVRAVILEQLRLISDERIALLEKLKALELGEKRLLAILHEEQAKLMENRQEEQRRQQSEMTSSDTVNRSSSARKRSTSRANQAVLLSSDVAIPSRSSPLRKMFSRKSTRIPLNDKTEECTVSAETVLRHTTNGYHEQEISMSRERYTPCPPGDISKLPLPQRQRSVQVPTRFNDKDEGMHNASGIWRSSRPGTPRTTTSSRQH